MKKTFKYLFSFFILSLFICIGGISVKAASFRPINTDGKKEKIGSNYIWREHNTQINIITKNGAKKYIKTSGYVVTGITNGNTIFYTVSPAKRSYDIILYKYTISTGKKQKIKTIKNAGHVQGYYNNWLYFPRDIDTYLAYNIKTKKTKIYNLSKGQTNAYSYGRYLYSHKRKNPYSTLYVYDLHTKRSYTLVNNCLNIIYKGKYIICVRVLKKYYLYGQPVYKCKIYKCNVTNKKVTGSTTFTATDFNGYSSSRIYYYDTNWRLRSIKY